jgi:hypothetical protein
MDSYDGGQSIELEYSCFRWLIEGEKVITQENRMENFSFDFSSLKGASTDQAMLGAQR